MAAGVIRCMRWVLLACVLAAGMAGCATAPTSTRLSHLAALQQHADQAYANRDWLIAAEGYRALAQNVPDNAAYWFRLGNSYAHLGQARPAVAAYRAALQRDPRIVPAWHNLGTVLLEQSQAAFTEAAAHAKGDDPLMQASALMAARVAALRNDRPTSGPAGSAAAPPEVLPAIASSSAFAVPPGGSPAARTPAPPASVISSPHGGER